MQVNEYDFKRINLRMKELDLRLVKFEHELNEFKSWLEARFPKQDNVEWRESIRDNQGAEE